MKVPVQDVVQAYKKTGLKPGRGHYVSDDGCACAVGVIAVAEGAVGVIAVAEDDSLDYYDPVIKKKYGLTASYTDGLIHGFDGKPRLERAFNQEDYDAGYENGKKIAEEVFK